MNQDIRFAFFGGEPLGVPALVALEQAGLVPELVVCNPDRPVGRKQVLTPPPVKMWAEERGIEVYQPESYKDGGPRAKLAAPDWDLFVVVAYNFILPQWLLELPQHGVLNLHPSLLPKLRGASPIRSAILRNEPESVGVTVMLMDEQMDHGPILAQQAYPIAPAEWPPTGPALDARLAEAGGTLLAKTIPIWLRGDIAPQAQVHEFATYCGRFSKRDSQVKLDPTASLPGGEAARQLWLAYHAFLGLGGIHFEYAGKPVKIKEAELTPEGEFCPLVVTPAGKSAVSFAQYRETL